MAQRAADSEPSEDLDNMPLNDRRRRAKFIQWQREAATIGETCSQTARKQLVIDVEEPPAPKKESFSEVPRAILAAEDNEFSSELVDIAVLAKTVQFVNHMILGSQMDLFEINELWKRLL